MTNRELLGLKRPWTVLEIGCVGLVGCALVGFFIFVITYTVGFSVDQSYMRRCAVWKDCDATAIRAFQAQGCEILGDNQGHKWGECN